MRLKLRIVLPSSWSAICEILSPRDVYKRQLYYIEHRSLALDLRIIARTLPMLLHGGDLYRGDTGGWDLPPVAGYEPPPTGDGAPPRR